MAAHLYRQAQALAIAAGLLRPDLHALELEPLLHQVLDLYRPHLRDAQVEVNAPHSAITHPIIFLEVFDHLLSNAVKYRRCQTLHVRISSACHDMFVCITLEDNGRGLLPHVHPQDLIRWFRRGAPWPPGLGLGLPVARALLRRQGGNLTLSGASDRGAIVRVYLPRTISAASARHAHVTELVKDGVRQVRSTVHRQLRSR